MSYKKIYRGEFANTLPGPNNQASESAVIVYNEGTEWTTVPAIGVDYSNTERAISGTKSVKGVRILLPVIASFTSASPLKLSRLLDIGFYVFLNNSFSPSDKITISIYNGATLLRTLINISPYGFSRSNTTTWQQITVPLGAFAISNPGNEFDTITISAIGFSSKSLHFDLITLGVAGQKIRIDINDTPLEVAGETITADIIIMGLFSAHISPILIVPDASLEARTAFWQTYVDFFTVGKKIKVTGSEASDGEYTITAITDLNAPTNLLSNDPGSLTFSLDREAGSSLSDHNVVFETIVDLEIIPIELDGDPLHISTIDNDEDKFTTIRPKQAEIKIHTGSGIDIDTFCEGFDNQFTVQIYVDDLLIFDGFLMIPNLQQEFLPDPNILTLTAIDGLSKLKDIALVKLDDAVPQFDWRLIDYITWALRLTGLTKAVNVVNSLRHGAGTFVADCAIIAANKEFIFNASFGSKFYKGMHFTLSGTASNDGTYTVADAGIATIGFFGRVLFVIVKEVVSDETVTGGTFTDLSSAFHFHEVVYLDSKTFEASIGLCINAYDVLTKILGEDSVLFQMHGVWWIVRIDEIEQADYTVTLYDTDGNFVSDTTIEKQKNIGEPDTMHFMGDNALLIPDRAYKRVKETFKYDNPQELLCNIAFLRGALVGDLPDEEYPPSDPGHDPPIVGLVYNIKQFDPECWTLIKGITEPYGTLDTTGGIKVFSQNGYEKSRVMYVNQAPVDTFYQWKNDVKIPMSQGDKFTASVDFRCIDDLVGTGHYQIAMFYIRLYGYDGSYWSLFASSDSTQFSPKWVACASTFPIIDQKTCVYDGDSSTDYTFWQSCSIDSAPLPVAGLIEFSLVDSFEANNSDRYFQNLRLDYSPLINGSYQRYTGQYNQVEQSGLYTAMRDKIVSMSDSPSLLLKGAMKVYNGTDHLLTFGFTDSHWPEPTPYGKIQAFAIWNQYRMSARNFDADVDLMESDDVQNDLYNGVDLVHRINLTDSNVNTNNRIFLILHYDQDFYLLEMKSFIASLFRTDIGKIYTDQHSFIYTTE